MPPIALEIPTGCGIPKQANQVHESRDVIWLKRTFYSKPEIKHDVAIKHEEKEDIEVVIPQHKAGESTKDGESINDEAAPTDDLLGERESEIDDEDSSTNHLQEQSQLQVLVQV
jgi:hypothetical protein